MYTIIYNYIQTQSSPVLQIFNTQMLETCMNDSSYVSKKRTLENRRSRRKFKKGNALHSYYDEANSRCENPETHEELLRVQYHGCIAGRVFLRGKSLRHTVQQWSKQNPCYEHIIAPIWKEIVIDPPKFASSPPANQHGTGRPSNGIEHANEERKQPSKPWYVSTVECTQEKPDSSDP